MREYLALAQRCVRFQVKLEDAEQKKTVAEGIAETVSREKAIVEVETAKAQVQAEQVAKTQAEVSTHRLPCILALVYIGAVRDCIALRNRPSAHSLRFLGVPTDHPMPLGQTTRSASNNETPKQTLRKLNLLSPLRWQL